MCCCIWNSDIYSLFKVLRSTGYRNTRRFPRRTTIVRPFKSTWRTTSIYLNLAGRESRGIVRSGEEADRIMAEIFQRLRDAHDPDTGAEIVRNAYLGREIYFGPQTCHGPDIVVGFEPGYRASWQTALGGAPEGTVADNDKPWSADHLVDPSAVPGVLATNVPVSATKPAGVDLAPTILDCLGVPVPSSMDGHSWLGHGSRSNTLAAETFAPEPELVGVASPSTGADGLTDRERAELEKHLGDLGYL